MKFEFTDEQKKELKSCWNNKKDDALLAELIDRVEGFVETVFSPIFDPDIEKSNVIIGLGIKNSGVILESDVEKIKIIEETLKAINNLNKALAALDKVLPSPHRSDDEMNEVLATAISQHLSCRNSDILCSGVADVPLKFLLERLNDRLNSYKTNRENREKIKITKRKETHIIVVISLIYKHIFGSFPSKNNIHFINFIKYLGAILNLVFGDDVISVVWTKDFYCGFEGQYYILPEYLEEFELKNK